LLKNLKTNVKITIVSQNAQIPENKRLPLLINIADMRLHLYGC